MGDVRKAAVSAADSASTPASVPPGALTSAECLRFSAACYCEENVVRLLRLALSRGHGANALFAIFISNPQRCVPLQFQRAGTGPYAIASWDYHVVAEIDADIYDVDCLLPFPIPRSDYFRRSCRPSDSEQIDNLYQFRRVPFHDLDALFASDRRHMRHGATGRFIMRPPQQPPIRGYDAPSPHTLNHFLVMGERRERDPFQVIDDLMQPPGEFYPTLDALLKALDADET